MKNKDGEDVIRSACGTKLGCIGCATISAEDGSCKAEIFTWNNYISAPKLLGLSNGISDKVEEKTEELNKKLSEVVAKTAFELTVNDPSVTDDSGKPIRIVRRAETNLGDLCADAYRDQSGAQIGFVNGGGIRATIDKGDITLEEILTVHPFGNMMCVVEVTGQQILDALEWNSRVVPGETGGFLQVSGLTYEIHTYVESSVTEDENGMFTGVDGVIGEEYADPYGQGRIIAVEEPPAEETAGEESAEEESSEETAAQ